MKPKQVQQMRPEFMEWPLPQFGRNLASLRDTLARDYRRMLQDCEYWGLDSANLYDHRQKYPLEDIPWHLSDAKDLMEKDIDDGLHLKMIPMKLQETRPEYAAFDPDTFRNHIYQEVKKREKFASKIRFGKKQLRTHKTDEEPAEDMMGVIDKYGDKPNKKPRKPAAETKKKTTKKEDVAALPEGRRAKATRVQKN